MTRHSSSSGSIFLVLFAALAALGVLGVGTSIFIKGPLSSSVKLTRNNTAQSQMAMAAQSAVMAATGLAGSGDCDADGYIEPVEWRVDGTKPFPVGGGLIPSGIGVTRTADPWGTEYGYCVWDHGPTLLNTTCQQGTPGTNRRLAGTDSKMNTTVAIIAAGPDKKFTTTCRSFAAADVNSNGVLGDAGDLEMASKASSGDDDMIFSYTYEEATGASGGLWSLKSSDANTATISKAIEMPSAKFSGTSMMASMGANSAAPADCTGLGTPYYNDTSSGNCYFSTASNTNWVTSKAACEAQGAYLASITSATENTIIVTNMLSGANVFIGSTDTTVEGEWRWVGGAEANMQFWQGGNAAGGGVAVGSMYNNWATSAPSTSGATDDFGILLTTGKWSNVSQTTNLRGICEISGGSPNLSMENGLRIGDASVVTNCNSTNTGVLRRAVSGANIEMCDGTNWVQAGGAGVGTLIDHFADGISNYVRNNIFLGHNTGTETTTGGGNILIQGDTYAANTLTTGYANTGMGTANLQGTVSGNSNTMLGRYANDSSSTASRLTGAGNFVCYQLGSGAANNDNVCIGGGSINRVATKVTAIGNAGSLSVGDIRAVWMGGEAGKSNTTGVDNTAIGHHALISNTVGANLTAVGVYTMYWATGSNNVGVGNGALQSLRTATNNTAIGTNALYSQATAGGANVAVGYSALDALNNAAGIYNIAIGAYALTESTAGQSNIAAGSYSSASLTNNTSVRNVAIGRDSLRDKTTQTLDNVAIGVESVKLSGATANNVGIGWQALNGVRSPSNVAVGYNASKLQNSATATVINTTVGSGALAANVNMANNTVAGYNALANNTAASASTAVGYEALLSMAATTASNLTAVGYQALRSNTANSLSTAVGYQALLNSTTGLYNTAIGYQALNVSTLPSNNVAVGSQALFGATGTAQFNTAIGARAGYAQATSNSTTFIGTEAGYGAPSQSRTNALGVGYRALYNGDNSNSSTTGFGSQALYTGNSSTLALGFRAGYNYQSDNGAAAGYLALGNGSLSFSTAAGAMAMARNSGSSHTAVGYRSMINGTGNTTNNSTAGAYALENITTGIDNIAIGYAALRSVTTASQNTALGSLADVSLGFSNSTAIGYGVAVGTSNTIRLGNNSITAIEGQVAWTSPSDRRLKKDITPSDLGLDFIMGLKPVSYRLKQGNGRLDYGFLAQDIEKSLDGRETNMLIRLDDAMKTYQLRSNDLIAPIVKAIQQRQEKIDDLKRQIAELQREERPDCTEAAQ